MSERLSRLLKRGKKEEDLTERRSEVLAPRSAGQGNPIASKSGFADTRIDQSELEKVYKSDGIAFAIINRYANAIVGPGFIISCKNPDQQVLWDDWVGKVRFKQTIHRAVKNAWIYGNGYIELIKNVNDNAIVDLESLYPPYMDFKKTDSGRIIYDSVTKKISGYRQTLYTNKGLEKNDFDLADIAHLRVMEIGEEYSGISPFEPLYKSIIIKMNIDEAMGESSFRQAFPIYVAYVGTQDRDPTLKELDDTHKEILRVGQRSVFTFPHYTRLERLDSPSVDAVAKYADYFLDIITAGIGLPRALLMPTPGVTYAALERLGIEWEKQVREYQEFLEEQIEDEIFNEVVRTDPEFTEVPAFRFREISPSMQLSKARRLGTLARTGLLVYDKKLEEYIRELEDLPKIDEATHIGRPMISMQLSDDANDAEEKKEAIRELIEELSEGKE